MKNDALKNLESITLEQIKDFIKTNSPIEFDKMIISPSEIVKRTDFMFMNYSGQYLSRTAKVIEFPMYGNVRDNFEDFSGGASKHGDKSVINSKHIFQTLESYGLRPQEDKSSSTSDLEFPISTTNNAVDSAQPMYFLSSKTNSWTCECCSGKKYVQCDDHECGGRHEWQCTGCYGKGQVTCSKCAGNKKLDYSTCNGSNKVRCSSCGGDGKKVDKLDTFSAVTSSTRSTRVVQKTCGNCSGRGTKQCTSCNNGKVTCSKCSGNGKTTCTTCSGKTVITCSKCYADRERRGMIDCPECKAMGELAKISFVETIVNTQNIQRIFSKGNNLKDVNPDSLMKLAKKNESQVNILKNFNDVNTKNYDELVEGYISEIQSENSFQFNGFVNRVTDEELYFQVIPCVQIEYRHMITNTLHNVTILNYFENPELVIDKSVENEKSDSKDKMKGVSRFFGKLFKTSKFKKKEDRKREIQLMIMLAKVDGKIEDQEKLFLAQEISGISEFTINEKKAFFGLMDASSLPELEKKDVVFYSDEAYQAVISKLESLAGKDGEIDGSEKVYIEKIKTMNLELSKPRK
jgi:hypothetical protein